MMRGMDKSTVTLYGIRNCDTVRRARQWMSAHHVECAFHDFKLQAVPPDQLDAWLQRAGWQTLLNRQGATWRKLDEATKAAVVDASSARTVMLEHPSVIKRPVVEWGSGGQLTVGFDPLAWEANLAVP